MSKLTKIIAALSLALLVLSYPTCQIGERAVHNEMAKYPAEFVEAHYFDWVFLKFVLPGVLMFLLGTFLAVTAIGCFIAERIVASRKRRHVENHDPPSL